jgi:hypothetical protein
MDFAWVFAIQNNIQDLIFNEANQMYQTKKNNGCSVILAETGACLISSILAIIFHISGCKNSRSYQPQLFSLIMLV